MNHLKVFVSFFLALIVNFLVAGQKDVHIHGYAQGSVVITESSIQFEIVLPSESAVGFEHLPQSASERELVTSLIEYFNEPGLFEFFEKSSWFKKRKQLDVKGINHSVYQVLDQQTDHDSHHRGEDDHDSHHHGAGDHEGDHHGHQNEDIHSNFMLNLQYSFEKDVDIHYISTDLFNRAKNLDTLRLTIVSGDKQSQFLLKRNESIINIKELY